MVKIESIEAAIASSGHDDGQEAWVVDSNGVVVIDPEWGRSRVHPRLAGW